MSARTFDWTYDWLNEVVVYPPGTNMRQHPMLSGVTPRHNSNSNAASHTSDIGFLAVELKRLADLIVDGVSKHGFGVGMLWLEHPALGAGQPGMGIGKFGPYYPDFDPSNPRPAIFIADIIG